MSDNIKRFPVGGKQPETLEEALISLISNNLDSERPYTGQSHTDSGKRGAHVVNGLTMRDIVDCFKLGYMECMRKNDKEFLPQLYISEKGNTFESFDDLLASNEGYDSHHVNPQKVKESDLFTEHDEVDIIAASQNAACWIERKLGIFPNVEKLRL